MSTQPHLVGTEAEPKHLKLPIWAMVLVLGGGAGVGSFGGAALFNWRLSAVEKAVSATPNDIAAAMAQAMSAEEKSLAALREEHRIKAQEFERRMVEVEHGQQQLQSQLFTKIAEVLAAVHVSEKEQAKVAADVAYIRGKMKEP